MTLDGDKLDVYNAPIARRKLGLAGIPGSGNVVGPGSSTDNAIVRFDGITGEIIKDSTPLVQNDGRITALTDPTGAQDAATKNYVDTAIAGIPGGGDVVGPAVAVDDNLTTFDGVTGKLIQDSGVPVSRMPSADQKSALAGTNGTPDAANPYVTNSDSRNTNARTPTAHATTHQAGGSDAIKLDDLAAPDDNTDLNSSTTAHGLLRKLSNVATEFLNGQGAWSVPAGGGDVVGPAGATGDNIALFDGATGKLIKDAGMGIANIPSSDQKAALAGTNGTPNAANPYVTNTDPRNTNARTPSAHAASHENGGSDEISVAGLSGALADAQKIVVRKNSGADVGTRSRLNFIEGANITLTVADDAGGGEVDITIAASGSTTQKRGCVFAFCIAYTPLATGSDRGEIVVPYDPDDGTTALTWNVRRITLRVETAGGAPSVRVEKSTAAGAFSAATVGDVTLGSGDFEGSNTTALGTVASGNKLRMNIITLATAQYWTVSVELGEN